MPAGSVFHPDPSGTQQGCSAAYTQILLKIPMARAPVWQNVARHFTTAVIYGFLLMQIERESPVLALTRSSSAHTALLPFLRRRDELQDNFELFWSMELFPWDPLAKDVTRLVGACPPPRGLSA